MINPTVGRFPLLIHLELSKTFDLAAHSFLPGTLSSLGLQPSELSRSCRPLPPTLSSWCASLASPHLPGVEAVENARATDGPCLLYQRLAVTAVTTTARLHHKKKKSLFCRSKGLNAGIFTRLDLTTPNVISRDPRHPHPPGRCAHCLLSGVWLPLRAWRGQTQTQPPEALCRPPPPHQICFSCVLARFS